MRHIGISKLTNTGSDNGLPPDQCKAIIWTNAEILLIRPFGTNLSEILIKIYMLSFKKMHFNMSSGKWRPFCLDLNVIMWSWLSPNFDLASDFGVAAWGTYGDHPGIIINTSPQRNSFTRPDAGNMNGQHRSSWKSLSEGWTVCKKHNRILGHISYYISSSLPCTIPFIFLWFIAEWNLLMSYHLNVCHMY